MALLTYHLSSVSNLHLILVTCCYLLLLGLMWVRGLGDQVLGLVLGSQVLVNITVSVAATPYLYELQHIL